MKKVALIALFCLVASCDIQRSVQKSETDTDFKENITTETKRKGDTVRYKVPVVTFRDTTIYTVSRQGTQLVTRYDTNGRLSNVDCISSEIDELRQELRTIIQNSKTKDKDESSKFDSTIVLYIMFGFAVICMFAFYLMFVYMKKNTQAVTSIISGIAK